MCRADERRNGGQRLCAAALVAAACLCESALTSAQDEACGGTGSFEQADFVVRPPQGADEVALDAQVIIRYRSRRAVDAIRASFEDNPSACGLVCLFRDDSADGGSDRVQVAGDVHAPDDATLSFIPEEALEPDAEYFALVPRPGFDRLTRTEVSFETGDERDQEPPVLDLGSELDVGLDPLPPGCGYPDGSIRVTVAVPAASDDSDDQSVEVLLHLSRAAGLAAPGLRARGIATGGRVPLEFVLDPEEASDTVCLALTAVDGVGRVSEDQQDVCFDPRGGALFRAACAVGAPGASPPAGSLIPFGAMALSMLLCRTRWRRGRRP